VIVSANGAVKASPLATNDVVPATRALVGAAIGSSAATAGRAGELTDDEFSAANSDS